MGRTWLEVARRSGWEALRTMVGRKSWKVFLAGVRRMGSEVDHDTAARVVHSEMTVSEEEVRTTRKAAPMVVVHKNSMGVPMEEVRTSLTEVRTKEARKNSREVPKEVRTSSKAVRTKVVHKSPTAVPTGVGRTNSRTVLKEVQTEVRTTRTRVLKAVDRTN